MQEERKVAVVVQARLNSQRVPYKMIRPFGGEESLFRILLNKLSKSKKIKPEDIYVSVGEVALVTILKNTGYKFNLFSRSQESCDSTNNPDIPDSLTLLYEWDKYLIGLGYTHVVLVSACHPLLTINSIDNFYRLMLNSNLKGAFSVTEKHNYYWNHYGKPITDWKGAQLMNTKNVKPTYEGAHCLYGSRLDFIDKELWMSDEYPPEPYLFVVDDIEATDIDTEKDFKIAEVLYKNFVMCDKNFVMCDLNLDPIGYDVDGKPFYSNPKCGESKII